MTAMTMDDGHFNLDDFVVASSICIIVIAMLFLDFGILYAPCCCCCCSWSVLVDDPRVLMDADASSALVLNHESQSYATAMCACDKVPTCVCQYAYATVCVCVCVREFVFDLNWVCKQQVSGRELFIGHATIRWGSQICMFALQWNFSNRICLITICVCTYYANYICMVYVNMCDVCLAIS